MSGKAQGILSPSHQREESPNKARSSTQAGKGSGNVPTPDVTTGDTGQGSTFHMEHRTFMVLARGEEVAGISCVIYGLVDPREPKRIRYVGKSVSPYARFYSHIQTRRGKVGEWMCELHSRKYERFPDLVLLEVVKKGASGRERWWYDALRAVGQADLNGAPPPADKPDFPYTPTAKRNRVSSPTGSRTFPRTFRKCDGGSEVIAKKPGLRMLK